jgi:hypothetical protein
MVVAQIGLSMGVIERPVYGIVVLMAIVTTLIAPPGLNYAYRKWRKETIKEVTNSLEQPVRVRPRALSNFAHDFCAMVSSTAPRSAIDEAILPLDNVESTTVNPPAGETQINFMMIAVRSDDFPCRSGHGAAVRHNECAA